MSSTPLRSIRVLCIDAGVAGAHIGFAQIKIVRDIMKEVRRQLNATGAPEPSETDIDGMRPSDHFDMIYGGCSGGVIAAYLGRLHLTIKECEDYYRQLGDKVYAVPIRALNPLQRYNYDEVGLERLLIEQTSRDGSGPLDFADSSSGCKAALLTRASDSPQSVVLIESDDHTGKTWEAIRATTASYFDFPSITVGLYRVLAPEVGSSNPAEVAWKGVVKRYSRPNRGIYIVSIGGGVPATVKLHVNRGPGPQWYGWWLYWGTKLCLVLVALVMALIGKPTRVPQIQSLEGVAKGSETAHTKLLKLFENKKDLRFYFDPCRSQYYRFNFSLRQDVGKQDSPESTPAMLFRYLTLPILGLDNLFASRQTRKKWNESVSRMKGIVYTSHGFDNRRSLDAEIDVRTMNDLTSVAAQLIANPRPTLRSARASILL